MIHNRLGVIALLGTSLLAAPHFVAAQDEGPAVDTSNITRDRPADTRPAEPAEDTTSIGNTEAGTVIVGDRESPIGLYIMPWRDSSAAADMDRPARLVEASLLPIDRPVFLRELQYHRALSGALAERNQVTPEAPVSNP